MFFCNKPYGKYNSGVSSRPTSEPSKTQTATPTSTIYHADVLLSIPLALQRKSVNIVFCCSFHIECGAKCSHTVESTFLLRCSAELALSYLVVHPGVQRKVFTERVAVHSKCAAAQCVHITDRCYCGLRCSTKFVGSCA